MAAGTFMLFHVKGDLKSIFCDQKENQYNQYFWIQKVAK